MISQLALIVNIPSHTDTRGALFELYREDELVNNHNCVQGYLSYTEPGVTRGPHEHKDQTDLFVFMDGLFELHLWSKDGGRHEKHLVGKTNPIQVQVPPGIVHAYKNVGDSSAFVLNFPNRLYKGIGKQDPVDEIRHELDPNSIYVLT